MTTQLERFLDALTPEDLVSRLTLALDGAGLGIWDWDPRDNTVHFDRNWCEMLGLELDETEQRLDTWESRVHPDDLPSCYQDIQAHMEGRTDRYENVHRMKHANGNWVYILDRGRIAARDADGQPARFTGTHLDVTATERAKRVLEDEERRLRAMVVNLPVPVVLLDRKRRCLAASQRWVAEHGPAEPNAPFETICQRPVPDSAFEAAAQGTSSGDDEAHYEDTEGAERWHRWSVAPWLSVDDDVAGTIVLSEDVTPLVRRRLAVENESRLAALGYMASAVGHEVNTPLQVILVESEELADALNGEVDLEIARETADSIRQTADRMAKVVGAMRALSRAPSDREDASTSVPELLDYVGALVSNRVESRGIRFTIESNAGDQRVRGSLPELGQVLTNLINNALDAVADVDNAWIQLVARADGDEVHLLCVDAGAGVAPEHLPRLMQPFFTTKPVGQGTGLGLSISRAVAQRIGGRLSLDADAEHTTFRFTVPVGGAAR